MKMTDDCRIVEPITSREPPARIPGSLTVMEEEASTMDRQLILYVMQG